MRFLPTGFQAVLPAFSAFFSLMLLASCARAPLKEPREAMRRIDAAPFAALVDDLPLAPLLDAVEAQARHLETSPSQRELRFGELVVPKEEYVAALRRFASIGRAAPTKEAFAQ